MSYELNHETFGAVAQRHHNGASLAGVIEAYVQAELDAGRLTEQRLARKLPVDPPMMPLVLTTEQAAVQEPVPELVEFDPEDLRRAEEDLAAGRWYTLNENAAGLDDMFIPNPDWPEEDDGA